MPEVVQAFDFVKVGNKRSNASPQARASQDRFQRMKSHLNRIEVKCRAPHLTFELGYLSLKPEQVNAFFRLMDDRYNRVDDHHQESRAA
jgi:hypothetical protein